MLGDRKGLPVYLKPLIGRVRTARKLNELLTLALAVSVVMFSTGFSRSVRKTVNKGNEYYAEGKYSEALKMYETVNNDARKNAGTVEFNIGDAQYKLGKYDTAVSAFQRSAFDAEPGLSANCQFNTGNAYYQMGDKKKARECYIQALMNNPDDLDAKYNLEVVTRQIKEEQQQKQGEKQENSQEQQKQKQQQKKEKEKQEAQNEQKKKAGRKAAGTG